MAVDSRLDRQHHVDNDHEDHNRKVMVDKFWRAWEPKKDKVHADNLAKLEAACKDKGIIF
jgi:hypothetical protein